jgi:hypothetical protein
VLIPFVQLEMAGTLGLPEGRYRSDEPDGQRVLIVQQLGAPGPARRGRRRPRAVEPREPGEVPITRLTVAAAERFDDRREAAGWLDDAAGSAEARATEVRAATATINRALTALRAAARDPLVHEIGATRALAVRIGYGTGEDLADGRWSEARELPPPKRGRLDDVDPQERVAAVLAGRERVHPAETLLQRARLDLAQGRLEEARYGQRAAAAAARETDGADEDLRRRVDQLAGEIDEAERG